MAAQKELQVQQKREVEKPEETTVPARFYQPNTDIFEDEGSLTVVMEMPGVQKGNVEIKIEKNVLDIEGKIDFSKYQNLEPLYTEYNVGHYKRSFSLSSKIDQSKISAEMNDGLLTLVLPKAATSRANPVALPVRALMPRPASRPGRAAWRPARRRGAAPVSNTARP